MKSNQKLREQLQHYRRFLPWITLKELLMIILCTIPYAVTVNQLLVPHAIVGGGVTGICEIIYFATNTYIPIWLSSAVINVVLLVIATLTVGWRYALRTVWGVLWLTIWLKVIPIASVPLLTDSFMAVVIGGLFTGCRRRDFKGERMFPLEDPFFLVLFPVILSEAKDPIKVPGIAAVCSLVRDDGQKGFHLAITDCSALWLKTCPRHFS